MKKVILLTVCLTLAGLLAVNGTFAADFTQAVSEAVSTLFQTVKGLTKPNPEAGGDTFKVTLQNADASGQPLLSPGSTVDREIAVCNQSTEKTAYFRIAFAVQAEAFPHLTLNFSNDSSYTWDKEWRNITIGNRAFKLKVATYTKGLEAGKTSPAALLSVGLSSEVTSEQLANIDDDFLQVQVLAIDAAEFVTNEQPMSATDALNEALPLTDDFNPFK